ncbi:MAG: 23S rRNA (guanosine(2251)-2'-O)-methyltransferase RlmB [Coriobacteriia bacterium]|nr:23S rRNA (guanosine(2251)-2'-O)-methyltransferase RlmB [Coriobacteriia bacterium]
MAKHDRNEPHKKEGVRWTPKDKSVIEGRNAVIEALKAHVPIARVMIARGTKQDRSLELVKRLCSEQGVVCDEVARGELDSVSERGAHQGVIAQASPFPFASLDEVLTKVVNESCALIIVLDHISDPGNLGAIVRSAEVVGASAVIIPENRSVGITPAAWKAAAGALAHLPLVQVTNIAQTIARLQRDNFWVAGASEHAEQIAWYAPLSGRIALVMGSEGEGLARLTQERCDFLVKLPQAGQVGSLNVAQACTVLAYEWSRQSGTVGSVPFVPSGEKGINGTKGPDPTVPDLTDSGTCIR